MINDRELLERYAESRCEAAFAELVGRYVNLVYSAALRQVGGDAHLAQDVTQSVFIDLARKAGSISSRTLLTGWLYTSTRFAAANAVRAEQRRRAREEEACTMQERTCDPSNEARWDQLRPVLDDAMHDLGERDRNAVLLRYFEDRRLADIAGRLGLSEDAARMRVERALEKLRGLLAKRGVSSTTAALAAVLAQQTVTAAPAGLTSSVVGAAVGAAGTAAGTSLTLINIMALTKLKVGIVTAVIVAGVATPLVMHQEQVKLRADNESLRQRVEQIAMLEAENARLSNIIAQSPAQVTPPDNQSNEVLRLRGEVARLRDDARELARLKTAASGNLPDNSLNEAAQNLAARATQLRDHLEKAPQLKIPELQLLTSKDWLNAGGSVKQLETDEDYRRALSSLRGRAKGALGGTLQNALRKYADSNGGMLPTDLSQLQQYLDQPVDPAVLDRYSLVATGTYEDARGAKKSVIAETAPPVDDEFDTRFEFGINGTNSKTVSKAADALEAAVVAYAQANQGLLPAEPSQITPYLQQPIDPAVVQKFWAKKPPQVTTLQQLKALK